MEEKPTFDANAIGCECSEEGVSVHATLDAKSHVTAMGSILDLEVSIAASSGGGDLHFRGGAHLVDTDEASVVIFPEGSGAASNGCIFMHAADLELMSLSSMRR